MKDKKRRNKGIDEDIKKQRSKRKGNKERRKEEGNE
jgi:hypothetical protein